MSRTPPLTILGVKEEIHAQSTNSRSSLVFSGSRSRDGHMCKHTDNPAHPHKDGCWARCSLGRRSRRSGIRSPSRACMSAAAAACTRTVPWERVCVSLHFESTTRLSQALFASGRPRRLDSRNGSRLPLPPTLPRSFSGSQETSLHAIATSKYRGVRSPRWSGQRMGCQQDNKLG